VNETRVYHLPAFPFAAIFISNSGWPYNRTLPYALNNFAIFREIKMLNIK
jgi:hypothetical protein